MQAASMTFRAYAIDLWGFGDTAKNPNRYLIENQVQLMVEFLDKMGIPKIALVGHGLGAIVALMFARQNPEIVDRLMVIGVPLEMGGVNPKLRGAPPPELADWLLNKAPASDAVRLEAPKADTKAIAASLDCMASMNWKDLFTNTLMPCLYVHGLNDPAINPPHYEEMVVFPESTHQILFEQSGHFPMLDENSKFNRLLTDFLSLQSGESPRELQLKEEWKRRIR
jgi:pimeloyl-ACP methyl ester carboxylesterase